MSQTERIYWIDAQIRAGRYPDAKKVSERFEVSLRTAYGDRNYLLYRLNAPLVFDRQKGGWTYSDPAYILPFLALSERESSALRRSILTAIEYLGAQDAQTLGLIAERLGNYLPNATEHEREHMRGSVHLYQGISRQLLNDCDRAIFYRHRIRLLYYTPTRDEITERIVHPYDLLYWRGEPHLIAFCELRQAIRQFFLGRVREWVVLEPDSAFVRDPAFDIRSYLRQGFDVRHGEELTKVVVRFSAYQARWIREREYHASQQTQEQSDGSLIMTLHVAGIEEVKRWLLGYGSQVEVLEPEALRSTIAEEAKKLMKIYAP